MNFMHYLSNIEGVSIYPIISLLMFFVFFLILFLRVRRMSKTEIEELKNIPFDNKKTN